MSLVSSAGAPSQPVEHLASSPQLCVAQVVRSLDTGGQEMLCARLAEGLERGAFRPIVISLLGGGWLTRRLEEQGIPVHCLNAPEGFRPELVLRLARLFRAEGVDVAHCHNQKAIFYGGLATLLAPRTRLVITKHGRTPWTGASVSPALRLAARRARAVIAVSGDVASLLQEGRWAAADQLETVLNGVDTEEFTAGDPAAARSALGLPPEARVVGTVARLEAVKDQATLLRGFAQVYQERPDAWLVLAGDGTLRGSLEELARSLGITDRTRFLGDRSDVAGILPALDVFCLPSLSEGTSLTLLEAMSCERPVVATAVGGNPEVVADGRSGFLIPPQRPDLLAERILTLIQNRPQARLFGSEGRRIVEARYSLRAMLSRHQEIYLKAKGL